MPCLSAPFHTGLRGQASLLMMLPWLRMRNAAWATALVTLHVASPSAQIWPTCEPVLNKSAEPTRCGSCFPVNSNRVTSHQQYAIFNLLQAGSH